MTTTYRWNDEVRAAQREALEAVDKLIRAVVAQRHENGHYDGAYSDEPGTVIDDLGNAAITGFIVATQYQFIDENHDPSDCMMLHADSGSITAPTTVGLVHHLKGTYLE